MEIPMAQIPVTMFQADNINLGNNLNKSRDLSFE